MAVVNPPSLAPTRAARRRLTIRGNVYRGLRPVVRRQLRGFYVEVAGYAAEAGSVLRYVQRASDYVGWYGEDRIAEVFSAIWQRSITTIGLEVAYALGVLDRPKGWRGPMEVKQGDEEEAFAARLRALSQEYLETEIATQIQAPVTGYTQTQVVTVTQGVVQEALDEGLNARTAARRLRSRLATVGARRAETIARTEVLRATSYSSNASAGLVQDRYGIQLLKEWNDSGDELVRPTHSDAGGQTVPYTDFYNVGGYEARYPHDPMLPVEEVAQCRCFEAYYRR